LKSTGIVRRTDTLGRVVIPKELRTLFNINEYDALEVFTEGETIVLKKYEPHCLMCGEVKNTTHYMGKLICRSCIEEVKLFRDK